MNPIWNELVLKSGRSLTPRQEQQLASFLDLLLAGNARMNLTRIVDPAAAQILHVADALTLLPHIPPTTKMLADVGSGGGVPGLPLAIVLPQVQVTLIESTKKKAAFLDQTSRNLGLNNVRVIGTRAEDVARTELRESFDVATVRAVGALAWVAEWCLPLVRVGGAVLAMKGARAQDELADLSGILHPLGGGEPAVHQAALPDAEHHVIVELPKTSRCDAKFPRNPTTTRGKSLAGK